MHNSKARGRQWFIDPGCTLRRWRILLCADCFRSRLNAQLSLWSGCFRPESLHISRAASYEHGGAAHRPTPPPAHLLLYPLSWRTPSHLFLCQPVSQKLSHACADRRKERRLYTPSLFTTSISSVSRSLNLASLLWDLTPGVFLFNRRIVRF